MKELIKILKAVSDKNRMRIIKMLEVRPLCVCEITSILGLATSTVSKHLSLLKDSGLLFEQKENKWVIYHLNGSSRDRSIQQILSLINHWLQEDETIIADRIKVNEVDRADICRG